MPISVGVIFELRQARTRPGEAIHVAGGRRELGKWQPLPQEEEQARTLRTNPVLYPCWYLHSPIWLEVETDADSAAGAQINLEYKFVRDRRGLDDGLQHVKWEVSIPNRRVSLPVEDSSIWIISHGSWNSSRDTPQVTRATPDKLADRLSALGVGTPRPGVPRLLQAEGPYGIVPRLYLARIAGQKEEGGHMTRRESEHFQLTPRQNAGQMDSGGNLKLWPIEAEFSANFSTPPMSPDMNVGYQDSFLMDTESDSDSENYDDVPGKEDDNGLFETQTTESTIGTAVIALDPPEHLGPDALVQDYYLDSEDGEAERLREEIDCLRDQAAEAAAKADAEVSHLEGELERLRSVATEAATESAAKDDQILELRLENERLQAVVKEASEEVQALVLQNTVLRESLQRARNNTVDLEEIQSPKKIGSRNWARTRSLRWCPAPKDEIEPPMSPTPARKMTEEELSEPQEEP